MRKDAKKYLASAVEVLVKKYGMNEIEAHKAIKQSFLYDSLIHFPDETLHDDIETNADLVHYDYVSEHLLQM